MEGNPQKLTVTVPVYTDPATNNVYRDVKMEITAAAGATPGANGGLKAQVKVLSATDSAGNVLKPDPTATPPVTLTADLLRAETGLDVQEFQDQ